MGVVPLVTLGVEASFAAERISDVFAWRGGWLVTVRGSRETIVLDDRLRPVGRLDLGTREDGPFRPSVASAGGDFFVVSQRRRVRVFDVGARPIYEWPHPPWATLSRGAAAFSRDGKRLWLVVPTGDGRSVLRLVAAGSWEPIAEALLDSPASAHELHRHPSSDLVVASLQGDVPAAYVVEERAGKLEIRLLGEAGDFVFGSFDPAGAEVVALGEDGLRVHAFPAGAVLHRLPSESLPTFGERSDEGEEDDFGARARFLSASRILVDTQEGRLLVVDRPSMGPVAEIRPEGYGLTGYDERGRPTAVAKDTVELESDVRDWHLAPGGRLLTVHRKQGLHLSVVPPRLSRL